MYPKKLSGEYGLNYLPKSLDSANNTFKVLGCTRHTGLVSLILWSEVFVSGCG